MNIMRWPSVRSGERKHIFPYQHHADAVFDSSLIYELSVLKVFAERYLLEVPQGHPAYTTAFRLLSLLDRFVTIYPDHVPPTSNLREFIGGSGFEYRGSCWIRAGMLRAARLVITRTQTFVRRDSARHRSGAFGAAHVAMIPASWASPRARRRTPMRHVLRFGCARHIRSAARAQEPASVVTPTVAALGTSAHPQRRTEIRTLRRLTIGYYRQRVATPKRRTGMKFARTHARILIRLVVAVAVLVGGAGCDHENDRSSRNGDDTLINGQPAGMPDLVAVAHVRNPGFGECSGTLIASRTVLTSAHCMFEFAQGCPVSWSPDAFIVTFADEYGNPVGAGAQAIRSVAVAAHPDAFGDRVSSCTNPAPPLPCADPATDPAYYENPSCALTLSCPIGTGGHGMHAEHDLALVYLEADPIGIDPIPVLIGEGVSLPSKGLNWLFGLGAFLETLPTVTIAGYGLGSQTWSDGSGGVFRGRDFGTVPMTATAASLDRSVDCAGNPQPASIEPMVMFDATQPQHAFVDHGDSGGPVLLGSGGVSSGMDAPTPLPTGSGILDRRYVIGVHSFAGGSTPTYGVSNGSWLLAAIDDADGDGVPNAADNCVSVKNADQLNCNLDAELDEKAAELGDACDPVPCPAFTMPLLGKVPIGAETGVCKNVQTTRNLRATVTPSMIGSHNPFTGLEVTDVNHETRFRFCQIDLPKTDCAVQGGQRRDFQMSLSAGPSTLWQPVTLPALPAGLAYYDFPSVPAPQLWDYWADRASWLGQGWISPTGGQQKPAGVAEGDWTQSSGLKGAFGLRSEWAFMLGQANNAFNGVHPSPGTPAGARLARHYEAMAPDAITTSVSNKCLFECVGPCKKFDVTAVLRWCPACGVRPDSWWHPPDPPDFTIAKASDGGWGALSPRGEIVSLPGWLGPELQARLNNAELRLVSSAEPFAAMQTGRENAQAVFAYADGSGIESGVVATERGFQVSRAYRTARRVPARSGHAVVYSRRLSALIVIGGKTARSHGSELWYLPLRGSARQLVLPNYQPAHVLAAVTSSADNALWILESPSAESTGRRLLRIDLASRTLTEVWNGFAAGGYDQHWLLSDRDGAILLVSSGPDSHCTLRWSAKPFVPSSEEATLMRMDPGSLIGPPLVDLAGYEYVTRIELGRQELQVNRVRRLVDQSDGAPVVEECL